MHPVLVLFSVLAPFAIVPLTIIVGGLAERAYVAIVNARNFPRARARIRMRRRAELDITPALARRSS